MRRTLPLVAAGLLALACSPAGTDPGPTAATTGNSTSTALPPPTTPPTTSAPPATPPPGHEHADDIPWPTSPAEPIRAAAAGFIAAHLQPGDISERRARLRPWVHPDRLEDYAIPPRNIPDATLAAIEDVTNDGQNATATARLSDGRRYTIGLIITDTGWRATTLARQAS